ncbi:MAG: AraC family transcriptional regulator [Oscillospiraceae bacterium]|nr:AraC family transcriptional regulator [Oscillospiraceae bacterium]
MRCLLTSDKYIKEHPGEPVTADALARACGYSLQHYCMIFRAFTGLTPAEYVRRVRLREASSAMICGKSVTMAAMDAGFESDSGFSRAFRKEYGASPRERLKRLREGAVMLPAPLIEYMPKRSALGYRIPSGQDHSAAHWEDVDFSSLPKYPPGLQNYGEVGMWLRPDSVTGELDYFFGCLTDWPDTPPGFEKLFLPEGEYAVFNVTDTVFSDSPGDTAQKMRSAWDTVLTDGLEELPGKSLCLDDARSGYELYRRSQAFICVPIQNSSV